MPDQYFARHLTLLPPDATRKPALIVGAGGVGSMATLVLAKMGFSSLWVIDPQQIGMENVGPQMYKPSDVGRPKVTALAETIKEYVGVEIRTKHGVWENEDAPLVVCAVDSMAFRKRLAEAYAERYRVELVVDARMGGEIAHIYAYRPADTDQAAAYGRTLYSDAEGDKEACTARAIAFNTFSMAGLIGALLKHHLMGTQRVPFETIMRLSDFQFLSSRLKQ